MEKYFNELMILNGITVGLTLYSQVISTYILNTPIDNKECLSELRRNMVLSSILVTIKYL